MKSRIFPWLIVAAFFAGCEKEEDTTIPTTIIEKPVMGDRVSAADGIKVVATISDDFLVSQYKISFSGIDSLNGRVADSTISDIHVFDAGQSRTYVEHTFDIPDSAMHANYLLTMVALDDSGNESEVDSVSFFLHNPLDLEEISFIDTVAFDTVEAFRNGIAINIDVFDDALTNIFLTVGTTNGEHVISTGEWLDINSSWQEVNQWILWDDNWVEGDYSAHVTAWDRYGYKEFKNYFYIKK